VDARKKPTALPGTSLPVDVYPDTGCAVVECTGEHDLTSKAETAALLKRLVQHYRIVVVDVSEAEYVDSSFITNLFIASRLAQVHDAQFRVQYATAPAVHRALEINGVLGKLNCVQTREEAVR